VEGGVVNQDLALVFTSLALVILAGFLAGVEAAFSSVSRISVEEAVRQRRRGAKATQRVLADPAQYLNVVLLVRKAAELSATVLVALLFLDLFDNRRDALIVTVLSMITASYVLVGVGPRTLGRQHPQGWALIGAPVAVALAVLLKPVTRLLIAFGNAITPGRGFREGPFSTEAELRDLLDQARDRGLVERDQSEMINSVFELGDTIVREVMVPRTEMVWIERNKTLSQALSLALRSGFSRIPVIGEGLDDVVGIAYVKDMAKRFYEHRDSGQNEKIDQWMRPATFIPESKPADELLREMQQHQIHVAVVVDEYGGTAGLITIEDILEEIVGEIADEFDVETAPIEWLASDRARVTSRLHLEDLASAFDVKFDEDDLEDVDTVGGLMAKHLGRVPIPGSEINLVGLHFTAELPIGRRRRLGTVLIQRSDESLEVGES
jgi:CBS domain containing-hemolysin-like protein